MTNELGCFVPLCKRLCKEFAAIQSFKTGYKVGMKRCSVCCVWIPKIIAKDNIRCPCCHMQLRAASKQSSFYSHKRHKRY